MMLDIKIGQWIIDATQKTPRWWCHQMACLMCIGATLMFYFDDSFWMRFMDVTLLICAVIDLIASFSDAYITFFADSKSIYRWLQWAVCVFDLIWMTPRGLSGALFFGPSAAFAAFSHCNPPAPPKPRGRLART